jgi:hypothetical protein
MGRLVYPNDIPIVVDQCIVIPCIIQALTCMIWIMVFSVTVTKMYINVLIKDYVHKDVAF